ncbi:hypothetical protein GYMLUDRAFT_48945 [Collybiopsis luxurians FD-317 M1]|uniref:Magnesium transporter n=1 Tax=Collybiopsis luxurians FD-317 M1 TaxID=944289 RepID=A0A0D0AUC1_9AGAR|nr:hypothetical protein GYMLUDRAFT_48945 [Collybiopsis luxurians FD-317 M1]
MATAAVTDAPRDRLRAAVRKVIALNQTSRVFSYYGAGAEPGVNARHLSSDFRYNGSREQCQIRVVDYSPVSISSRTLSNDQLINMLSDARTNEKPSWAKIRWIDVGGISWDVIKMLSIKYKIHPLALENIMHSHSNATASKSDYYLQHLFLRILCLELRDEDSAISLAEVQRKATLDVEDLKPAVVGNPFPSKWRKGTGYRNLRDLDAAATVQIEALKHRDRVEVNAFPIFILLFRDGTVITIHRTTSTKLMEPILNRLSRPDTLLRTTSDPSFLVQSLLDLVVDKALGLAEACENKMKKFEMKLLLKPEVETVSNLHILTGDISLHQRALEPLRRVIYGLRRYDLDRCIALLDTPPGEEKTVKVKGYISHAAQIYLADVYDHMDYILASLDKVYHLSENLIQYSFNLTSYEMNVIMRRLTLITVICLPLTFLTGYGGMNFEAMWWTKNPDHSDVWFWIVALPVMAVIIPFFLIPDIKRLYHTTRNVKESQNALKSYQVQRGLTRKSPRGVRGRGLGR